MMPIARMEGGRIIEERALSIEDVPPHKRSMWLPVITQPRPDYESKYQTCKATVTIETDRVVRGWIVEDRALSPEALKKYVAAKRYEVETSGTVWNGVSLATDRESQTKVIAEFVAIMANVRGNAGGWKSQSGVFVELTDQDMQGLVMAVRAHVAAAFATEAAVLAAIDAGTITSPREVDAASWPSNP